MSKIKCKETTDIKKSCNTCKYSSSDGFYAPNYWCNKNKHHEDRGGEMYGSWKDGIGTVCNDWTGKNL